MYKHHAVKVMVVFWYVHVVTYAPPYTVNSFENDGAKLLLCTSAQQYMASIDSDFTIS